MLFQSTPPARGATSKSRGGCRHYSSISIHAPREGGDVMLYMHIRFCFYFNPRPPRGGRPPPITYIISLKYFNPRPPRGGRLRSRYRNEPESDFNPRPPRGGRLQPSFFLDRKRDFNPRPPRGGRLITAPFPRSSLLISIHAPREGGDR